MMEIVNKAIRILVVFHIFGSILCQDRYNEQENIQLKHIAPNDGQVEAITGYSTNVIQNNSNRQSIDLNGQYAIVDGSDKTSDYDRLDRGRVRKIYRIKNPFQQPEEEATSKQDIKSDSQDSETGASNQYTSMQYSLPPEEFLQRLRANNQYYQHQPQQQQQQETTPVSTFGYTATPQPQYQYSTIPTTFNNGNPQNSVSPSIEHKKLAQVYDPNFNNYQYNNGYSFGIEAIQSTPSSVTLYLSTNSPNNQFVGTPSNNYVSSSSPIYQSSPTNLQSYISSTLSNLQTGPSNYNNNRNSPIIEGKSFNYGSSNRDTSQNIHVNHYDNSANGVQHPVNTQQQFQIEYPSSTQSPISSTSSDVNQESWQNPINYNSNNALISRQELLQNDQYSSYRDRQQDTTRDPNQDNQNIDTHRVGSMPSANNIFLSFARPEYQAFANIQNDRDMESQQNRQTEVYSHGDYGWKLDGKKPLVKYDVSLPSSPSQQQSNIYPSNSNNLNSLNRYVDNGKNYDDNQTAKLNADRLAAHEFAKAAAKAHENMRKEQQVYLNSYSGQSRFSSDSLGNLDPKNVAYKSINHHNSLVQGNGNTYNGVPQSDLIKGSPYYFANSRDSDQDNKFKQLINEKGIQAIINNNDVSSLSPDINTQIKFNLGPEVNTRYNTSNSNNEQNLRQFVEIHNNDDNTLNNYNVRTKLEEKSPLGITKLEQNFEHPKQYDLFYNTNSPNPKPHSNLVSKPGNYFPQAPFDSMQQHNNLQHLTMQRPQNQGNLDNINLKLSDVPYWLTQSLNNGKLHLHNGIENVVSTISPLVLNQNIEAHQLDVAASILNKLIRNKPIEVNPKPDFNNMGALLSHINGPQQPPNPYNFDLKLVSEILKGRTYFNDNNIPFSNPVNQIRPMQWDTSQLQQLMLKNDNFGNSALGSHEITGTVSPFYEININSNFPQQGVKYSRSQEEEESLIPLTDSRQNHAIGSVIEEDDVLNDSKDVRDSELAGSNDDNFAVGIENDKLKLYSGRRFVNPRLRHINLVPDAPYHYNRKVPKMVMREPYPLLKPPPVHNVVGRNRKNLETYNRRQRANKLRFSRLVKREPVFEEEDFTKEVQSIVPTILRPPPTAAEDKVDALESDEK